MPEDNNPSQPISLSQGKKLRRRKEDSSDEKFEISEARLRTIMAEVVNKEVSSKLKRLEKSINKLASQFEGYKSGNPDDAALRVTTDSEASDLALADFEMLKEDYYPYLCHNLAVKLKVRNHDIIQMIKIFELRENSKYHLHVKTGSKTGVNKWSEETYQRLKQAIDSGEYTRPTLD